MNTITIPIRAYRTPASYWWVVDGLHEVGEGKLNPNEHYVSPTGTSVLYRVGPPQDLRDLDGDCAACEGTGCNLDWCTACGDEYDDPCSTHADHNGNPGACGGCCHSCLDGQPLVQVVIHEFRYRQTYSDPRGGDWRHVCECGKAKPEHTLGVGTIDVYPVVFGGQHDLTGDYVAIVDGGAWLIGERDDLLHDLPFTAEPGQFVVKWTEDLR